MEKGMHQQAKEYCVVPGIDSAENYFRQLTSALSMMPLEQVDLIAERLLAAYRRDATIFTCGNGGSASLASHMACDLGKGTVMPGEAGRLRIVALTDNLPLITALANDLAYDRIFAEQLRNLARAGDLLFAISASGNSRNILRAIHQARAAACEIVGITGYEGGEMESLCDTCLVVPANNMQMIEDAHLAVAHCVFSLVRNAIATNRKAIVSSCSAAL